jgi:hypothetical protein
MLVCILSYKLGSVLLLLLLQHTTTIRPVLGAAGTPSIAMLYISPDMRVLLNCSTRLPLML